MHHINHMVSRLTQIVDHMELSDCVVVVTCVVAIGFLCLRGMESRSDF